MFNPRRVALCAASVMVLASGVLAAGGASAQTNRTGEAASLQDNEDVAALVERMEALKQLADAEGYARRVRGGMETGLATTRFSVGPLSVVAREEQQAAIALAIDEALPFYTSTVRGGSESVLSEIDWYVQFYDGQMPADIGGGGEERGVISVQTSDGPGRMVTRTREELGQRLVTRLPSALREWAVGSPLIAPGIGTGYSWSSLHRTAVSAGSVAVRDCLAGEATRCWSVLGFPETESVVTEWYSEDEIRLRGALALQQRLRGRRAYRRGDGSVDQERVKEARLGLAACRTGGLDQCMGHQRFAGGVGISDKSPLPAFARTSLLWHALEKGGEGAYARLAAAAADGASIPDALGAAAGESPSALVASWGHRVAQARPVTQGDLTYAGFSSLFWLLSFAGLAVFAAQRRSV